MRGTRVLIGTAAALLLGSLATVKAQDQEQDPSSRVLRASYLQGEVSFRPGTVDDWTSATLNYPLSSGDHLWTDTDARAELHVGSNAIRLGPETAFEILDLDDNHLQIRLTQGSALIRLRTLDSDDNVEIDTPTGAVTLIRDGTYRIDVSSDGATSTITARNGDAEVTSNANTVPVRPNETVLFTADGASPDVRNASPLDEYDRWADARDRAEDQSVSAQYVSRDMTGYEDLDRNGSWSDDAEYGHVWAPTLVVDDWAPYRYGRWAWVEPYGWTWIDDAPWGFAPFHYGRWAYVRNRWVWAPGIIRRRPVYAPALVVFVGGSNFHGGRYGDRDGVAWFPLAPNEVYRPAYRVSDRYVRRVNVTNVHITNINITNVNVTNIQYRNRSVQGATTSVPQDQFAGSRRIGRAAIIVPVDQARSAHVVGDGAPVAPTQQSVLIRRQNSTTVVRRPPEATQARQVVWKNTPPPRPATFQSHVAQLQTNGDKPVAPLPISQTRGAPRSGVARGGISHTDAPATVNGPTNNDGARPLPNTRPNINVRSNPNDQAQRVTNPNAPAATVPTAQPGIPANTRAVPQQQPNTNVRPTPVERPNTNDRPMSHTDGPSPVSGSPNGSPAHTVGEPSQSVRPAPPAQPVSPPNTRTAPRTDVQQPVQQPVQRPVAQPPHTVQTEERKSPAQGERPQPVQQQQPKRTTDAAPERRRVQTEEKPKQPDRDGKPPRRV
ncbi:MAG: hypothetical protein H0U66_16055 [Gemmatimonadaceae bacterium]|nr:hypothetical protein [Gemmatimonadaceae bacterium]